MRKKYIFLFFLFVFNTISYGQKVTLTLTSVNGANVNTGPINLASIPYSTITLGAKVEIPDNVAVGDQGTIKIYYSASTALGAIVTINGNGGALYFGGGKTATRSFIINLNWTDFLTSGGYIYAEYKNSDSPSGTAFKSQNIAVIKNATMTTGTNLNPPADAPNPTKIPNTLCCDQIVRVGDKPAIITGTTFLNPYQGEPYGINTTWIANGIGSVRFLKNSNSTLEIDYLTETGKFTITRGLGYSYGGQYPNKSNSVNITVVPSPIINEILIDGGKDANGFVEVIDSNPKQIYSDRASSPRVNLNILENPYHIPQLRGDSFANIDRYEWQYAITNQSDNSFKNWITFENENLASLEYIALKNIPNSEDNYLLIRRIAFYKNISNTSNILKIIPRTLKNNNVICCDQVLALNSTLQQIENPSIITGSAATIDRIQNVEIINTAYQWQRQAITNTRPNQYGSWSNISEATAKDYLPIPLQFVTGTRGRLVVETTYNYRRITTITYKVNNTGNYTSKSFSNETNIQAGTEYRTPTLIAYPNPVSSILYVENKSSDYPLTSTRISVTNILGINVNTTFTVVNENLISINVSNLVIGTYFINVESDGGVRGSLQKLTFIKTN